MKFYRIVHQMVNTKIEGLEELLCRVFDAKKDSSIDKVFTFYSNNYEFFI